MFFRWFVFARLPIVVKIAVGMKFPFIVRLVNEKTVLHCERSESYLVRRKSHVCPQNEMKRSGEPVKDQDNQNKKV